MQTLDRRAVPDQLVLVEYRTSRWLIALVVILALMVIALSSWLIYAELLAELSRANF